MDVVVDYGSGVAPEDKRRFHPADRSPITPQV